MKSFLPVLMTARERESLLAEFDGTVLRPGRPAVAIAPSSPTRTAPTTPSGVVEHLKAALATAMMRLTEAGARR